jgi:hypothetical protein
VDVKVVRKGVPLTVVARKEYVLKPLPKPVSSTKK